MKRCRKPECLSYSIIKTEFDPQGGILTYVEKLKYPLRGFPRKERLDMVAFIKRLAISTLRFALKHPLVIAPLIFYRKSKVKNNILEWMNDIFRADYGNSLKIPVNEYSQSTKEIIRALTVYNGYQDNDFSDAQAEGMGKGLWIYLLAVVFDTDLAYRYRGQDILPEFNKISLRENPRKEIKRVLKILEKRELSKSMKAKLKALTRVLTVVLLVSPKTAQSISGFIQELNLEEVKFDIRDKYWVSDRYDYDFHGQSYDERMEWRRKEEQDWTPPTLQPVNEPPRIIVNKPNEAFYHATPEEAEKVAEETKQVLLKNYYDSRREKSAVR